MRSPANEPLSINVDYDRARLAQDDIATATATVRNNMTKSANMVMVDLGIPPGFDLLTEDLPVGGHAAEGEPHPHAGDSVLRFARRRRNGHAEISPAGEVSDPRANVRLAGL